MVTDTLNVVSWIVHIGPLWAPLEKQDALLIMNVALCLSNYAESRKMLPTRDCDIIVWLLRQRRYPRDRMRVCECTMGIARATRPANQRDRCTILERLHWPSKTRRLDRWARYTIDLPGSLYTNEEPEMFVTVPASGLFLATKMFIWTETVVVEVALT